MLDRKIVYKVNKLLGDLYAFAQSDSMIGEFRAFVQQEANVLFDNKTKFNEVMHSFLFDYIVDSTEKIPMDLYLNSNFELSDDEKCLIESFKQSIHSVFQIKNKTKDSFELCNLVDNTFFNVFTINNFLNYKHIQVDDFIFARIFPYEDFYIVIGNLLYFPKRKRDDVYQMVSMLSDESNDTSQAIQLDVSLDEETIDVNVENIITQGRNELCLCGSGKKFKKCCLTKTSFL